MKATSEELSFPISEKLSKEYLKNSYWKCLYTKTKNPIYHYWTILPNRMQPIQLEPISIKDLDLINIGQYTTVDSVPYLEVWVAYENYKYEINASDWLKRKLAFTGEVIIQSREIVDKTGTGKYLDALCKREELNGNIIISRFTVIKDYNPTDGGGNYFFIKASCFIDDYNELENDIFHIVANWGLLNRANWRMSELLQTIKTKMLDNIVIFSIPDSWQVNQKENRLVIMHNIQGYNYGVINLYCYNTQQYETAEDVYLATISRYYENTEITIDTGELKCIDIDNQVINSPIMMNEGILNSPNDLTSGYFSVYIFKFNNMWCYLELLGGMKNKQDYHWEVNIRCLEMILHTLK